MNGIVCYTSVNFGYLDRARVLGRSLKKHHPDWTWVLGLTDKAPGGFVFDIENEPFDRVLPMEDLGLEELESWAFKHDVVELCTAVKAPMLEKFLAEGWEKIFYLDPDIAVFSRLDPLVEALDRHSIVLTPHQLAPEAEPHAVIDNEICSLQHGTYNLGFLAVRNDSIGCTVAEWWTARLKEYCVDEKEKGIFVDQKWFDLVPALFDRVLICRDPGYNVASWNLSHRKLSVRDDGLFINEIYPLRFYHFTKLGPIGDIATARYAGNNNEIHELWSWYKRQVRENVAEGLPTGWWAYGHFADGKPISKPMRILYRQRKDLQIAFPKPFTENGISTWMSHHFGALA
jgi:hypothetical protein